MKSSCALDRVHYISLGPDVPISLELLKIILSVYSKMGDDCVHKRDGRRQPFLFDKILGRIKALGKEELKVNYSSVVQ